jgi:hypothetical protein
MAQRYVVKAAAYLEIVAGAICVITPKIPCILVFGVKPENIDGPLARWVGVSLFALGIACLPSKGRESHRSAVLGLFLFNAGLTILLASVGAFASVHGFMLWPIVILHLVIAVALLPQLLRAEGGGHV